MIGRGRSLTRCACGALIGPTRPWTCSMCGVKTQGKHYKSNRRRRERQARAKVLAAQAELADVTLQRDSRDVIRRDVVTTAATLTINALAARVRWSTAVQR